METEPEKPIPPYRPKKSGEDWKIRVREADYTNRPGAGHPRKGEQRHPPWTPSLEEKFLTVFRQTNLNFAQAARSIGIPRDLVSYHLRQTPAFAQAIQAIRDEKLDSAESLIHEKSQESVEVAKWVLERKRPEEWSTTRQVRVEGEITHLHDVKQLTEGQLEGLLQAHQQRLLMLEQQGVVDTEYEEVEDEAPAEDPEESQD